MPMCRPKTFSARSAAHFEQAGARVEDVVRTVVYLTDIDDAELVGRAHREVFGDVRPASTMVQVVALVRPEMRVEIEAYAVIDAAA